VYKHITDQQTETFIAPSFPYDKPFLLSKFKVRKDTMVYVDNKDRTKYFFDIDFVYE
jgi:hypothetical protein